jgi:hypothetical protein
LSGSYIGYLVVSGSLGYEIRITPAGPGLIRPQVLTGTPSDFEKRTVTKTVESIKGRDGAREERPPVDSVRMSPLIPQRLPEEPEEAPAAPLTAKEILDALKGRGKK